jgi:membrane protein
MRDVSPEAPEQRARRRSVIARVGRRPVRSDFVRPWEIAKRVLVGVYSDGFIHAGNLAYLALFSLFPFFIVSAAVGRIFGSTDEGLRSVGAFLHTLPPGVADVLAKPIGDVLAARSGSLLWLGAIVGLWTTGSFIETIRDILRRAYGTTFSRPFWHYRLTSIGIIVASVVLAMAAFSAQVLLTGALEFVDRLFPISPQAVSMVNFSRLAPGLALFGALYMLFYSLTPSKYRYSRCPKWPGALFTACWWVTITAGLPLVLARLGGYDLTYGSLAGVVITLFFFWLVGFGLVIGAHLNAALVESPEADLKNADVVQI